MVQMPKFQLNVLEIRRKTKLGKNFVRALALSAHAHLFLNILMAKIPYILILDVVFLYLCFVINNFRIAME